MLTLHILTELCCSFICMWKYQNCRLLVWLSIQNCNVILIIKNLGRHFKIFKPCFCQNQMYVLCIKFVGIVLFDVCNGKSYYWVTAPAWVSETLTTVVNDKHVRASRVLLCRMICVWSVFIVSHGSESEMQPSLKPLLVDCSV